MGGIVGAVVSSGVGVGACVAVGAGSSVTAGGIVAVGVGVGSGAVVCVGVGFGGSVTVSSGCGAVVVPGLLLEPRVVLLAPGVAGEALSFGSSVGVTSSTAFPVSPRCSLTVLES